MKKLRPSGTRESHGRLELGCPVDRHPIAVPGGDVVLGDLRPGEKLGPEAATKVRDDLGGRHGSLRYVFGRLLPTPPPAGLPGDPDFWALVNFIDSPTGCWIWIDETTDFGHGIYHGRGAHRVAKEFEIGPIDRAIVVRHTCDNAPCVRLDHLITGTHAENMRDMTARKRAPWQRTQRQHPKMLDVIVGIWARARGLDPYALSQWIWRERPMPIEVRRLMQEELRVPVHPTELGAGL